MGRQATSRTRLAIEPRPRRRPRRCGGARSMPKGLVKARPPQLPAPLPCRQVLQMPKSREPTHPQRGTRAFAGCRAGLNVREIVVLNSRGAPARAPQASHRSAQSGRLLVPKRVGAPASKEPKERLCRDVIYLGMLLQHEIACLVDAGRECDRRTVSSKV